MSIIGSNNRGGIFRCNLVTSGIKAYTQVVSVRA
jgi:hypothetical protein